MRLNYCRINNFGDAINPLVFNTLLPGFFDDMEDIEFIGIGSLLGLETLLQARKKIIFSTGFAYGYPPTIDHTYDIICLRGPLTARAIGVDKSLALTDGAILLNTIISIPSAKRYEISFMPHWESENKFRWDIICSQLNINYISPQDNINIIIDKIGASKLLVSEAMHGVIAADALRVPWIPFLAYRYINTFKWLDWTASMHLQYDYKFIPPLYDDGIFAGKTAVNLMDKVGIKNITKASKCFRTVQDLLLLPVARRRIKSICKSSPYLSNDGILNNRVDKLLNLLQSVRKKYG